MQHPRRARGAAASPPRPGAFPSPHGHRAAARRLRAERGEERPKDETLTHPWVPIPGYISNTDTGVVAVLNTDC